MAIFWLLIENFGLQEEEGRLATVAKIGSLFGEVGRELSETKDDSATYRMNRKKRKVKRRRKKRRRKKRRSKKRRRTFLMIDRLIDWD